MYVPLTDIVTCPRCGPEWSLILLADRVEDRRVLEGAFGCPNCRTSYPVEGGFADLRPRPAPELREVEPPAREADRDAAVRISALLGLGEGLGSPLLAGHLARLAPQVAALVERLEVVALDADLRAWPEEAGVTRIAAKQSLPFRDRSLRGAALVGEQASTFLEEVARVVWPTGRILIEAAPEGLESRFEAAGLEVMAREGGTVLAVRT